MSKFFTTRSLVVTALMIALSVILRLLGFPQDGTFRIELGFLPIALASFLYGPVVGGLSYVAADIVGTLFTGMSPFPPITLCKFFIGVIFGLFFYKKKVGLKHIVLANLFILVLIDLIAMPFALLPISGGKALTAILSTRLLASIVNVPIRIISLWLTFKYLNPEKLGGRQL